jgi:serine/threonine protein phosphatase PrpC
MNDQKDESGYSSLLNGVKFSYAISKGDIRKENEDRWHVEEFKLSKQLFQVAFVVDGHGGKSVADFIKKQFVTFLKHELITHKVRKSLENTFINLNDAVKSMDSGSTLSVLLLVSDVTASKKRNNSITAYVSNVGDSSIYGICTDKKGYRHIVRKISLDHNFDNKTELARVQKSDQHFVEDGYLVIKNANSMLAMSKAIGDSDFGDIVSAKPLIKKLQCDYFGFILGSDGIFDVINGKKVWNLMKDNNWKTSAKHVLDYRMSHHRQHDNSTLLMVYIGNDPLKK